MTQRPANLYVVLGWKVGENERNVILFEKGEEAMAFGISLTIGMDGKKYFAGKHMATVKRTDAEDYVAVAPPTFADTEELRQKMDALGIRVVDDPMIYVIAA
jgi:hypothetical protein